jgi:hypothetical protein
MILDTTGSATSAKAFLTNFQPKQLRWGSHDDANPMGGSFVLLQRPKGESKISFLDSHFDEVSATDGYMWYQSDIVMDLAAESPLDLAPH